MNDTLTCSRRPTKIQHKILQCASFLLFGCYGARNVEFRDYLYKLYTTAWSRDRQYLLGFLCTLGCSPNSY